jgi:hypothetical protein
MCERGCATGKSIFSSLCECLALVASLSWPSDAAPTPSIPREGGATFFEFIFISLFFVDVSCHTVPHQGVYYARARKTSFFVGVYFAEHLGFVEHNNSTHIPCFFVV